MWLHYPGSALNNNIYRSVRLCTSHLAFGTPATYRASYTSPPSASLGSTLGVGNLFWTSAPRAEAGGTFGYGIAGGAPGTCYKYTVWCFGTHELYDLGLDPYELNNRQAHACRRPCMSARAHACVRVYVRDRQIV